MERVSVDSSGNQANGDASAPFISADGRYVIFQSKASNLVAGDTNLKEDIFLYDRQTNQTTRVSVDSSGNEANGDSWAPSICAAGRYAAFASDASNLVANDGNHMPDIFVRDCQTGVTTRVSVDSSGNEVNWPADPSDDPCISADGRYVAFRSSGVNLVSGDTNSAIDVFVHDRQSGATTRVSVKSSGEQVFKNSYRPSMTTHGRYVAFDSLASNLAPGQTTWNYDAFVHDRQTHETTRVSVDSAGNQGNDMSLSASISADGRFAAFESDATNLVPGDTNGVRDIFVHDRSTGQTTRVSVSSSGNQADGRSFSPSIGGQDGRYVVFCSNASNLVPGDTGREDIFVHDRQTHQTIRLNVGSSGDEADNHSRAPCISADGNYVAFESAASNLVSGDTNALRDIFVTRRLSLIATPVVRPLLPITPPEPPAPVRPRRAPPIRR
ncbi:MAG: PD40 domain-containing protein [Candidatus Eiseniibacteriota bacterium]|nr:MAG: PD40 domain-containing protein [Candidatus Eisenbacteria bacterium]